MKNLLTKLTIAIMILIRSIIMAAPASAETTTSQNIMNGIPVRFQYDINTKDIEQGNAIPLEIVHDIYIDGKKIFAQGGAGYAYVDTLKQARSFGRGGELSVSRGELIDVEGKAHHIYLSANANGDRKLMPMAGALMGAASTFEILEGATRVGSATGILFGAGTGLATVAGVLGKGKEATISRGKVMFATIIQ